MNDEKVPVFPEEVAPGFRLRIHPSDASWTIECSGALAALDAAAQVQPQLLRLHDALVTHRVPQVTLDMHAVDYMNSSAIKGFVTWFLKAEWSKDHPYTIDLLYDPMRAWQTVSFTALERLVPNILRVRSSARA
jgi:hypothetical protein